MYIYKKYIYIYIQRYGGFCFVNKFVIRDGAVFVKRKIKVGIKWEQEPQSGTRMGTKWEQEPQSGTRMGTKWEQEPQSGTRMGAK